MAKTALTNYLETQEECFSMYELDIYCTYFYGLTRDELRYILASKEVQGEDFSGETVRVVKEKEIRLYGEYRTRRLVLEAWDGMDNREEE
jgi:hypothetical protein